MAFGRTKLPPGGPQLVEGEVDRLLSDTKRAAEIGARARRVVDENTGATERVLAYLQ